MGFRKRSVLKWFANNFRIDDYSFGIEAETR